MVVVVAEEAAAVEQDAEKAQCQVHPRGGGQGRKGGLGPVVAWV